MEKLEFIGMIGEYAVARELTKRGYDVVNLNSLHNNYKNVDLVCVNPKTGKSVTIQVKTGTTHNILTGLTSELDGSIPKLREKIVGPWAFVEVNLDNLEQTFYILTREETIELIQTSNDWYVNKWNRKLSSKPIVGVEIAWLQGGKTEASKSGAVKQYPEYASTLKENSIDKWKKITELLEV